MRFYLAFWIGIIALAACAPKASDPTADELLLDPVFHAAGNPPMLADWGQVISDGTKLRITDNALVYDLNTPLFSDYALKLRTVHVPNGVKAVYNDKDVFDFPVGTVITKTFYYPRGSTENVVKKPETDHETQRHSLSVRDYHLLETRVLARRDDGWAAFPYVWNEAQTEASLKRIGDIKQLVLDDKGAHTEFAYVVPNANQCAGCHATNNTTRKIEPIGPKARHLNRDFIYDHGPQNQLIEWAERGILTGVPEAQNAPQAVDWTDAAAALPDRARAYLDINCAHCHNQVGPADTSGLHLEPDTPMGPDLGMCKPPIAAGTGTGGLRFGIVPGKPEDSIFVYRTASTDPAVMMPELGRALAHAEGVALLEDWIAQMDGDCG